MKYISYGICMTQSFIAKLRKDKEFQKLYDIEKKKLDIAIALAEARAKKGLTQKEVARIADVTWETISAIENGRANSSLEMLSKIFAAVGKKLDFQIS